MLELVVHRVFTRARRTDVNMTLDTTVGDEEIRRLIALRSPGRIFQCCEVRCRVKEGGELGPRVRD